MIHKIQYFESKRIPPGTYLQDIVNQFLESKGENIIAVHPVMDETIIVHYVE